MRAVGGGLTTGDVKTVGAQEVTADKLVGFQIAGADKKWAWADASTRPMSFFRC